VRLTGGLPGAKVDREIVPEEGATSRARGGERGLTDGVRLWWGGNVGDAMELPRRWRASMAGGGLWSDLEHGEEAYEVRHHRIEGDGQGWRLSPKRVLAAGVLA
jgi:hypothetical protein